MPVSKSHGKAVGPSAERRWSGENFLIEIRMRSDHQSVAEGPIRGRKHIAATDPKRTFTLETEKVLQHHCDRECEQTSADEQQGG